MTIPDPGPSLGAVARKLAGRRVLITGGLGFVGSNLARLLLSGGSEIVLLDALIPGHGGLRFNVDGIEDDVEVVIGDARDQALMRRLAAGSDVVFSLAGQTSHLDSMANPDDDLEHNCRGPLAVLEACRHVAPDATVVFASTRQLYGRPEYIPVDEEHPIAPVDVNGIHKWAAEAYHALYRDVYGMRIAILRMTNTYGPRMRVRDARQTFLGLWIRRLIAGEVLEVYGDGTQRRDFNYIDDALAAFVLAATVPAAAGSVFNLGDDRAVTLRELAELLASMRSGASYRLVDFPPERKAIDIGDFQADSTRIRETLGWEPRVPLTEGLRRTVTYFERYGAHYWSGEATRRP